MATSELTRLETLARQPARAVPDAGPFDLVRQALSVLASLKLTVVLFALSIFLIFVGTLSQKDHDIWDVLHSYFHVWFAQVEFRTFERLVQMFFKSVNWNLDGYYFYFPGGKLLGSLLLLNLFSAHAVRFEVAAKGQRLAIGLGVLALGLLAVALAIGSGMNDTFESELSPAFCSFLWQVFRGALALLAISGVNVLRIAHGRIRPIEWRVLLGVEIVIAGLAIWLLADPTARPDDSGMRILWQLTKGAGAGLVLLAGTILVFQRRAGIVLLHGGVVLMMLSGMWTALTAKETQISIPEGDTVNYSYDIRSIELALTDRSSADSDRVTVVPGALLTGNVGQVERITDSELPVAIQVLRWLPNSTLRKAGPVEPNPATVGLGREAIAEELPPATGMGDDKADYAAAYVELFQKQTGKSLGTFLLTSLLPDPQSLEVDGRTYDVTLRFQRTYWPFSMMLKDFRFDRYAGSDTAKNFSSLVELRDPEHHVQRDVNIYMNNPLRYADRTFYQSSFDDKTETTTILQVVTNPGWMTPYVGCMLVVIGMIAHFGVMLVRFIRRRAGERTAADVAEASPWLSRFAFPTLVVLLAAGYLFSKAQMPTSTPSQMQIYEFGRLPVSFQGRIKPYDTLASNSLQYLSDRQQLKVTDKNGKESTTPAIRWLLDVISGAEAAADYRVFRIENLDIVNTLELEQRPGAWRYSYNELQKNGAVLEQQAKLADEEFKAQRPLSLYQRKVRELDAKLQYYAMLAAAFRSPQAIFDADQLAQHGDEIKQAVEALFKNAPHAIPPETASIKWNPLIVAELDGLNNRQAKLPVNLATVALGSLLEAYQRADTTGFNQQLVEFRRSLAQYENTLADNTAALQAANVKSAEVLKQSKINFEVFFNHFSPFFYCMLLYVVAFVLGALSWLTWTDPLRRAANWLLCLTFAVHTLALWARLDISGRPPVTNLYSAAVFIGWAAVLLALVLEYIYRLGFGSIVASVVGFLTLVVAHFLSLDGDTMIVLQAVLDTQFWLATHVVCISLGYATTYVAGLFGILYILLAHVFPTLNQEHRRQLSRMTYGTLCFAILFSFFGTVLGGLWADDSWGRFWGWDPKENGALIIVLYNALVLHARWGAVVKGRGFAMLTVGGNIVVTWSFFGVNELGVGLHSYGASESSTAMWLLVFAASQLAIIALGAMPQRWFDALGTSQSDTTT